jgi:hypothetical protein
MMASCPPPQSLKDLEDLKSAVAPSSHRLPLVAEIILFENNDYIADDVLKAKIGSLQRLYNASKHLFVLKLSGKLAPNLATLNDKIMFAYGLLQRSEPVLVELSYERMKLLASLPESCFLHGRIYPSLKYYIRQGDEENSKEEIKLLLNLLKQFSGIKVVVSISIQQPWPNIMPLLKMLREDFLGLVRMIEFTLERSPSVMVESVKRVVERREQEKAELTMAASTLTPNKKLNSDQKTKKKKKKESPEEYHPLQLGGDSSSDDDEEEDNHGGWHGGLLEKGEMVSVQAQEAPNLEFLGPMEFPSLDVFDLICHLSYISGGELTEHDFQPMSLSSALEPFLELVGIGKFAIRPSATCGFSACFFSTEKIDSASVAQYIDLNKFSEAMKPLLPSIREKGIGFFTARLIKKAIKSASKVKLPDLVSIMADSSKTSMVNEFVDKLQFLVIHNHMDVATLDMSRRCDCSVLTVEKNSLVASCTGCL